MSSPWMRSSGVPDQASVKWSQKSGRNNAKKVRLDDGSMTAMFDKVGDYLAKAGNQTTQPATKWNDDLLTRQMGPFVNGAPGQKQNVVNPGGMGPHAGNSAWSGGPLGAVPKHAGWGGLTEDTKQWALRLMGKFPGLRFTSGYRDPAYNKTVGGVANSGHTRGVKVDFVGSMAEMRAAEAWAKSMGARTLIHPNGSGNGGLHLDISWDGVRA